MLAEYPVGLAHPTRWAKRLADYYQTISLPLKQLMLSCSTGSQNGAGLRESIIMTNAARCLRNCRRTGGLNEKPNDLPLSPMMALEELPGRLKACGGDCSRLEPVWRDALGWLLHSRQWSARTVSLLRGFDGPQPVPDLPAELARCLYRDETVSISRLETFAGCPYSYFITYGLKPEELKEYGFDSQDRGNFFHHVLQRYAELACREESWPDISDERMDQLIEEAMAEDVAQWRDGPLGEDALACREAEKLRRVARVSAHAYTRQARENGFRSLGQELVFGEQSRDSLPPLRLQLQDGSEVLLRGKVDRVDVFRGQDGTLVRVIDYKSSSHTLDPERIWLGTQLQLLLYLQAVSKGIPGARPAGAFYFHVQDPRITLESLPENREKLREAVEKEFMKRMRLKGIVLSEVEVLGTMKAGEPDGELGSLVRKDGHVGSGSSSSAFTCSREDMDRLLEFEAERAAALAGKAFSGRIDAEPREGGNYSPCTYCRGVLPCPRDHSDPALVRQESKMAPEELFGRLSESRETQS